MTITLRPFISSFLGYKHQPDPPQKTSSSKAKKVRRKKKIKLRGKTSKTTLTLLCIIAMLGTVLATVLYTLEIPMTWDINIAYGLELQDEYGTPISNIAWGFLNRGENKTVNLILQSRANKPQNVTLTLPTETSEYVFGSDFPANLELAKEGQPNDSVAFTIWLKDKDMTADGGYSGNIIFDVVDVHPSDGYEEEYAYFSKPTQITYETDCSDFLLFINDEYNTEYNLSATVSYNFTTECVSTTHTIDSFSYKIELWKDGILYSTPVSTMYDCIPDIGESDQVTVNAPFTAPNENGTYQLKLYYTGHNSESLPLQPTLTIVWTSTTGFTMKRQSTPITSPYAYEFVSGEFSDDMYCVNDGSGSRFLNVEHDNAVNVQRWTGSAWIVWSSSESIELDALGTNEVKWRFQATSSTTLTFSIS